MEDDFVFARKVAVEEEDLDEVDLVGVDVVAPDLGLVRGPNQDLNRDQDLGLAGEVAKEGVAIALGHVLDQALAPDPDRMTEMAKRMLTGPDPDPCQNRDQDRNLDQGQNPGPGVAASKSCL